MQNLLTSFKNSPARILTACGVKRLLILLMSTSRSSSFKSKLSKIDGSLILKKEKKRGQGYFTDNWNTKHNTREYCVRTQALVSELEFKL